MILEPLAMSQQQLCCPVDIFLKGSLAGWNWMQAGSFLTESWVLHISEADCAEHNRVVFHQLLRSLVAEELHMVNLSLPSTSVCFETSHGKKGDSDML